MTSLAQREAQVEAAAQQPLSPGQRHKFQPSTLRPFVVPVGEQESRERPRNLSQYSPEPSGRVQLAQKKATRRIREHKIKKAEEQLTLSLEERDMDAIDDALKKASRVGVDAGIVANARVSSIQIADEMAAAEALAIEAHEAEQQGLVSEPVSIAIARAQKRVNERLQKKIAVEVADMQKKAPLQLNEGFSHGKSVAHLQAATNHFREGTHRMRVKGLGGPTMSLVTKGTSKSLQPPPPPPPLPPPPPQAATGGAVVIRRAPSSAKPPTIQNPKSGLSVDELQKVFPASQTADEHANPVTPEVEQEVSPRLSTAEIGLLFSVKSSSTYNRNAIAAEKRKARSRIGRAVVAKIPSGHMPWPPPPPAEATGKRTAFDMPLPEARNNVGDLLSLKNPTTKLTNHTLNPPIRTADEDEDCDIELTRDEVESVDEDFQSEERSEGKEDAEVFEIPQVATEKVSTVEENTEDDASPTDSVGKDKPIIPAKDRCALKNSTSTETGSEEKRMSGQCVRGKGWSWQHREPLLAKPKRIASSDTANEQPFRAEGDEAIMLSRGTAGGWKVASSKPLGRSSTRSRNLHSTRQKIVKPLHIRKKERTPYATTLHATNDFGARQKFQPYTAKKQGNSVASCFSAPHNTTEGRGPLNNAVGLLKSRREDEFLKVWNSSSIAADRRIAV